MAQCAYTGSTNAGTAVRIDDGICQFYLLEPTEYAELTALIANGSQELVDFGVLGITPEEILYTMTWGMGVILMMWSLGYAVGVANKLIKSA